MPNLPTHMSLASRAAAKLAHPTIERHVGSYLLGSTSPDIRIMTKWSRDTTHFAPLSIEQVGEGVQELFRAHPSLADSSKVPEKTRAFLSGYFSHLVADEAWILEIYRPHFDGHRHFPDQVRSNIWDRAIQLEMDESAIDELGGVDRVRSELDGSDEGVDLGFISPETLKQWRKWVAEFITWEFTWERLRFHAKRMYQDNEDAQAIADEFLEYVPDSLERVYNRVPAEKISAYRQKAINTTVRTIKEYLSVPESA